MVATIGYEDATVPRFLDALREAGVELLVDVRAVASSRKPGFAKSKLAANVGGAGIEYLHLRGAASTPRPRGQNIRGFTSASVDIMKWENERGHIVQNHGPLLTKDKLKDRVLKQETNIPNPANRPRIGGEVPQDFRVWRGKDAMGAARWNSDEVVELPIGDFINKHLKEIRASIKNGQEFTRAHYRVGRNTGQGWFTTHEKKAESMFYKEDLDGMTIVIRARKNHVPTKDDPEGWYVHTAYPDSGMR